MVFMEIPNHIFIESFPNLGHHFGIDFMIFDDIGSFGRIYLGGEEQDIMAGYGAAVAAIEGLAGREAK